AVAEPNERNVDGGRAEVVHERSREEVAVLVPRGPFEERGADTVGEAAAKLPLGEQWIEQAPCVVDGDVVEHAYLPGLAFHLDGRDIAHEPVRSRGHDLVVV